MKLFKILTILSFLLFLSSLVYAGHESLSPTGILSIKNTSSTDPHALALQFDLSTIPNDVRIDLAELKITIDSDTELGKSINIVIHSALSEWIPSLIPSEASIQTSDSLFTNNYSSSGDNVEAEINVTELVRQWHEGDLTNEGFLISIQGNSDKKFKLKNNDSEIQVELSVFYSK